LLTKSKFISGRQCHKLFWYEIHKPDIFPGTGPELQKIFDQGHEVNDYARKLFPGGILLKEKGDSISLAEEAKLFFPRRKALFEASLIFEGNFARVDVLEPCGQDQWNLIEIKSTTSAKEVHYPDLAFQWELCERNGLGIARAYVLHLNKGYIRQGELDLDRLFQRTDVTDEVRNFKSHLSSDIKPLHEIMQQKEIPDIAIGAHCNDPYECPLKFICWKHVPPVSVMNLKSGGKKSFDLLAMGVKRLEEIPNSFSLSDKQQIQVNAHKANKTHLNPAALRGFLDRLEYPLSFLDFETFGLAVPPFDGCKPYQQIPFQYSLHIVEKPGGAPQHRSFLAKAGSDPRPDFLAALQQSLPKSGSIIAYNLSFEDQILKACAKYFPGHRKWIEALSTRYIDLLKPFRDLDYYDPGQAGSASLKDVLPALTGKSYEGLVIGEGGEASREFLRFWKGLVPPDEIAALRQNLLDYCCLDTAGMIDIVENLKVLVDGSNT
jgi:hypothetical protein